MVVNWQNNNKKKHKLLCIFVVFLFSFVLSHEGHLHHDEKKIIYPTPRGPNSLSAFPLNQVKLLPGTPAYIGQQINAEYLHLLDADRMLYNFLINAGFSSNAEPLGGWEAPDCQLRGHFVGTYLSASAKAFNSYNDTIQKEKADYMVAQMYKCQQNIGTGYFSAFPSSYFDTLENLQEIWAPYYTIHKIMQGLWDMFILTGNSQAEEMVIGMAKYFTNRIKNVINTYSIYRWQLILNNEFGGMNDIMYQVYSYTGNPDHLWMAQMFDAGAFLGPILMGQDELTTLHANMHIPIVIGQAQRYEIVGDEEGKIITENFYGFVVYNRSYATGGHNGGNGSDDATNEHWGDPGRLSSTLTNNNQEFCTTYNTLKLVMHLIQWSGKVEYMDFYERAFFNGILGASNFEAGPGVMLYNYPLATGFSKNTSYHGWGDQNNTFWCCYATGVEQWAKMGEAIYFKSADDSQLYVNLYVASTLNWTSKNITIIQQTTFPEQQGTGITIKTSPLSPSCNFTLNLHIPYWADPNMTKISVNGIGLSTLVSPSSVFSISREWQDNDVVNVSLSFSLHLHEMNDDPTVVAIMYGPLVLGGLTSVSHTLPISNESQLPSLIKPVEGNPLQFTATVDNGKTQMKMQPIFTLTNENYGVYWKLTGN